MAQIATLEKPPYVKSEISARAWADLRKSSPSLQLYHQDLVRQQLEEIGCAANGGSYLVGGVAKQLDYRFRDRGCLVGESVGSLNNRLGDNASQAAEVAARSNVLVRAGCRRRTG